jgi:predicted  nucleic acid-binding Zn-ribbon protein
MADQIEQLKQLQAVDGELFKLRKQRAQKPLELERVNARVQAQEQRVKAAETALTQLQLAQKEKEVELQSKEASVKKLQGQLFQVKTNKEYTAMQHEIDALKADNSLLEEAILKAFDAIDQASKQRKAEQQRLAEEQASAQTERGRVERETEAIDAQVAQLDRTRKTLLPDVPPKALAAYERILSIREGLALVPLINDACGGCHRRLPPQVINQVFLKADLVMCESCNRILYFDEAHSKL